MNTEPTKFLEPGTPEYDKAKREEYEYHERMKNMNTLPPQGSNQGHYVLKLNRHQRRQLAKVKSKR